MITIPFRILINTRHNLSKTLIKIKDTFLIIILNILVKLKLKRLTSPIHISSGLLALLYLFRSEVTLETLEFRISIQVVNPGDHESSSILQLFRIKGSLRSILLTDGICLLRFQTNFNPGYLLLDTHVLHLSRTQSYLGIQIFRHFPKKLHISNNFILLRFSITGKCLVIHNNRIINFNDTIVNTDIRFSLFLLAFLELSISSNIGSLGKNQGVNLGSRDSRSIDTFHGGRCRKSSGTFSIHQIRIKTSISKPTHGSRRSIISIFTLPLLIHKIPVFTS